jgi:hypothetical protein
VESLARKVSRSQGEKRKKTTRGAGSHHIATHTLVVFFLGHGGINKRGLVELGHAEGRKESGGCVHARERERW